MKALILILAFAVYVFPGLSEAGRAVDESDDEKLARLQYQIDRQEKVVAKADVALNKARAQAKKEETKIPWPRSNKSRYSLQVEELQRVANYERSNLRDLLRQKEKLFQEQQQTFNKPLPNYPIELVQQDQCAAQDDKAGPMLRIIPPGAYVMGSPVTEFQRDDDEGPQHWVTLQKGFAIGLCEVTRGQFKQFVDETGYLTDAEKESQCHRWNRTGTDWITVDGAYWRDPGFEQSLDHPVVCVSFNDAKAYLQWLSQRTGFEYRLPTEAEWEFAARGGTTSRFISGDCIDPSVANYNSTVDYEEPCKTGDEFKMATVPVGNYPANPFGLYDMFGNVMEWVEDCRYKTYQGAPVDGSAWQRSDGRECTMRIMRGGSWWSKPRYVRSGNRSRGKPYGSLTDAGFRVARDLNQGEKREKP